MSDISLSAGARKRRLVIAAEDVVIEARRLLAAAKAGVMMETERLGDLTSALDAAIEEHGPAAGAAK